MTQAPGRDLRAGHRPIQSPYWWVGDVQVSDECLGLIRTRAGRFDLP
jgi:uncharacterized protein involved in tolerance to divalent cations